MTDEFLFPDFLMTQKFRVTTEILEQFVTNSSQDLEIAHLVEHTGRPVREVTQICRKLQLAGLVQPTRHSSKVWMLVCDPCTITLEDVYRGMIAHSEPARRSTTFDLDHTRSVDLLIMQATMEVNQSIFKHLRRFSLGHPRSTHSSNSRL